MSEDAVLISSELPHAGFVDDEIAFNADTEKTDIRKIKIKCPKCGRLSSPLCSKKTTLLSTQNVGHEYDSYHSAFKTRCRCGQQYKFTVTSD